MQKITCPHCGKAFEIDEAGYADILKQVRDSEFEQQLHDRLELAEQDKQNAIELAKTKAASELQRAAAAKDAEIQELKGKLDAGDIARRLAVSEALSAVEKERDALANKLQQASHDKLSEAQLAEARLVNELQKAASTKDSEIQDLKAKLDAIALAQKLAISEAVNDVEKERDALKNGLERSELEKQLATNALKEKYETQIKDRDDAIERLRDMKARLSTKMVGETLEQHCETEFNRLRATAFPKAYFEKDNDAKSGSKGDYIFRDMDDARTEIVSIMFEMKNENDGTATKKKNIGFFEKLPSIPFHVVPHKMADQGPASDQWLLSPSTCYHTFSLLSGINQHWPLKRFTATSNCHRFEPEGGDPLRMASFTMREFVFVGEREAVEQESEAAFLHSVEFLRRAGFSIDIEVASDIFYGEGSAATRKVQKALGVKLEALTTGPTGRQVSVASRNFHRDLFTSTFDIGDASRPQRMYSACVAFGVERLLLSLLAATPGFDPSALMDALRLSSEHCNTEQETA